MRLAWTMAGLVALSAAAARADEPDAVARLFAAIAARDAAAVHAVLKSQPSLAGAERPGGGSAVITAALTRWPDGFRAPARNPVLQALLAERPPLGFLEACVVGDADRVSRDLARDASRARSWHAMGWSALHLAAFSGDVRAVNQLLDAGAAIDARAKTRFRNTPLQAALLAGQEATARRLLERGADALVRQAEGFAPLHEAAFLGRRDLVDLLLEHGAETGSRTDDGRTPAMEATRGGHSDLAAYLAAYRR